MAALEAQLLDLRRCVFTADITAPGSVALLQARSDALATTHAALLPSPKT